MKRRFIVGLIVIAVAGWLASGTVDAAWSGPTRVLNGDGYFGIAAVVDSGNHVHLAASSDGIWYATNRTGAWVTKRILNPRSDPQYRYTWDTPLIAVDENDRIYVAATEWRWSDDGGLPSSMGAFYVTDKGRVHGTFPSTPSRLGGSDKVGTSLRVANGRLYATLICDRCSGIVRSVWFRTLKAGTWTTVNLGQGSWASMRLPSNGRPRIALSSDTGIRYAVASSSVGGFTTTTIPGTTANDDDPILAIDAQGHSSVVWWRYDPSSDTEREFYSALAGGVWSSPTTVASTVHYFLGTGFDVDTNGHPHVVTASFDKVIRDRRLVNGTWMVSVVASSADVYALTARRAGAGKIVVAWTTPSGVFVSKG